MPHFPKIRSRHRSLGQSVVEFALIVPVMLLLLTGGIDFGRVFLGWINLNNTARIAANYAASNAVLLSSLDPDAVADYNRIVLDDAAATNCKPTSPLPLPLYSPDTSLGSSATVKLSCSFGIITPIISVVLGNKLTVSSSAIFPIRSGVIANTPSGGVPPAVASFNISPTGGSAPVSITFSDTSTGNPVSYEWDFNGDSVVDSTLSAPPPYLYTVPGTYQASLKVSNGLVSTTASRTIPVTGLPGPIANFTFSLSSPTAPSTVTFTDTSTGNPTIYSWDFGDGTTSTAANPPAKVYAAGNWTVTLTVNNALGPASTTSKNFIVLAPNPQCLVPDFKGLWTDAVPSVQNIWQAAGFQTTVIFSPIPPPKYKISGKQNPNANTLLPCAGTTITVFDK